MRKSHEQRQREIIQAALELAADQGVARATTAAIAKQVGIAQPTVFRHFEDRDAIFRAAIDWVGQGMREEIWPLFEGPEPADRRLHAVVTGQLTYIARFKGMPRILFSDRLHLESPDLKAAVREVMGGFAARLADLIREGVEQDRFGRVTDPEAAAWQVVALIQGTLLRWSLYDFAFPLADQSEGLWAFVAGALGAPEEGGE